jgi:hypothetical protein
MRDFKRYWDEVREIRTGLPEFVSLVSIGNGGGNGGGENGGGEDGGAPVEAGSDIAARLLHAKTHRIATSQEVVHYQAEKSERNRREAAERRLREGIAVVEVEAGPRLLNP